ncbi:Cullin-4B [Lobulomyces angularis]|nr:Cullin-4B [Lobulomyces angularis]
MLSIQIKPFEQKPVLDPVEFQSTSWIKLKEVINAIHKNKNISTEYSTEQLYRIVQVSCLYNLSEPLYNNLQQELNSNVQETAGFLNSNLHLPNKNFLTLIFDTYSRHLKEIQKIRMIFLYLDRTFLLKNSNLLTIWDLGLTLFKEHCFQNNADVRQKVLGGVLNEILQERSGNSIDRNLLENLVKMFLELGVYFNNFESQFLEESRLFYKEEGKKFIEELKSGIKDVSSYITHCQKRLKQENDICSQGGYLDSSTKKNLLNVVEVELIKNYYEVLLNCGFKDLLNEVNLEKLLDFHSIFSRVDKLESLYDFYGAYIIEFGEVIIKDGEPEQNMIQQILDLKNKLDMINKNCFKQSKQSQEVLKKSFEYFINKKSNKLAELIAKHIDQLLKKKKNMDESALEEILNQCLVLFRYVQGKDVFEAFYQKDLAKRLLLGKSSNYDLEKSLLLKLKNECGGGFTLKLEGMFKDIDMSKETMSIFKESKAFQQCGKIDLNINILSSAFWPTYFPVEVNLPEDIAECQRVFNDFYVAKHKGRKLTFQNTLGSCILKANFEKGAKELQVSLFQSIILLQFNNKQKLQFQEIKNLTNIEEKELMTNLQSLVMVKQKILIKEGEKYSVNEKFEDKLFRIKINSVQLKQTVEDQLSTHHKIHQDRKSILEANIVRIMKMRKKLGHKELVQEVLDSCKFTVEGSDIKHRIESLIEREYIVRDDKIGGVGAYIYLAKSYELLVNEWKLQKSLKNEDMIEIYQRILRDVKRTDQNQSFYKKKDFFSLNEVNESEDGLLNFNLIKLQEILCTYSYSYKENRNQFVQGMCDICSILLLVFDGDASKNFDEDGEGIQGHLEKTGSILKLYQPRIYNHLRSIDCLNLFICYRWYLVLFRREFNYDDILLIWETIFTSSLNDWWDFVYHISVSILEQQEDAILKLNNFDEILYFVNTLSMKINVKEILERTEFIYLPLKSLEWCFNNDEEMDN